MSALEEVFARQLEEKSIPFERELMLIPGRRFRFDFVFEYAKLVAEIEGGTWSGGRHTRGKGFEDDCIKYNLALEQGYRVLRFTSRLVKDGSGAESVERILHAEALQGSSDCSGDDFAV